MMLCKLLAIVNLRNTFYVAFIIFVLGTYCNNYYIRCPCPCRRIINRKSPEFPPPITSRIISNLRLMTLRNHTMEIDFTESLKVLNAMGQNGTNLKTLEDRLKSCTDNSSQLMLSELRTRNKYIMEKGSQPDLQERKHEKKEKITIAIVSCGSRGKEALVLLKSVTLFSQDAALHVVLFGDRDTILQVGQDILFLKWQVNALGWDFTYELHLEWFPPGDGDEWREMYTTCATQRLFFPSLLPHIDSLIYMDTDVLVVSNLTELWLEFHNKMKGEKLAGLAANNEPTAQGWYNIVAQTPYYGSRGLNAGVMLMNLTLMRSFRFEEKSIAAHKLYREKIQLADQDIVNIIFHAFPDQVHQLDCSYNFNWVHCGHAEIYPCHNNTSGESDCFCNATLTNGVQIIHGNSNTFVLELFPFLVHLYSKFQKFDLLTDSPAKLFSNLTAQFKTLKRPCHPLTAEILYQNAEKYFKKLQTNKFKSR